MKANNIDALMLTGGTSMEYFTGIRWGVSERLLAAIIPVKGSAFLVTPKFEEERAMEQAHLGPLGRTDAAGPHLVELAHPVRPAVEHAKHCPPVCGARTTPPAAGCRPGRTARYLRS